MDRLTKAYLTCALWSSSDDDGQDLDAKFSVEDFSPSDIAAAKEECDSFRNDAGPWLDEWTDEQAGHDFWLTRNHHGAGFWDRGLPFGDELTMLAHAAGEQYVLVGDDGKVFLS